ncbi:hypothetical protein [Nibribacter koreensis]|uniref:Uncharacterized protein n=1 Tax=Nibribacter koreensis TaxID=1084519 RepID=A0ABP8FAY0_9BACT
MRKLPDGIAVAVICFIIAIAFLSLNPSINNNGGFEGWDNPVWVVLAGLFFIYGSYALIKWFVRK